MPGAETGDAAGSPVEIRDQVFAHETVRVDGRAFYGCKFSDCEIEFAGGAPPRTIVGCEFARCRFTFVDGALNTFEWLHKLHRDEKWGRGTVEGVFKGIRSGNFPRMHLAGFGNIEKDQKAN